MYFCSLFFEDDNLELSIQGSGADTQVCPYSKLSTLNSKLNKGMYGFDSKMNCHVSMPSLAVTLVNLDCKRIIGENNYAFAA